MVGRRRLSKAYMDVFRCGRRIQCTLEQMPSTTTRQNHSTTRPHLRLMEDMVRAMVLCGISAEPRCMEGRVSSSPPPGLLGLPW